MSRRFLVTWSCVAGLLGAATTSRAEDVEEFYRTHQLSVIVGFNVGGAMDPYARTVARHMSAHLPGSPVVVVKNMPGAGSVLAANHLYNRSPRDGSEIGFVAGNVPLEP